MCDQGLGNSLSDWVCVCQLCVKQVCLSVMWLELACVFGDLGTASGIGCLKCVSDVWLQLSCVFRELGTASVTGCLNYVSAVGLGTASATGCLKCVSAVGLELLYEGSGAWEQPWQLGA